MRKLLLAAGLSLLSSLAVAATDVENKWRLELSGNAETAGQVTLAIAGNDAEAILATVPIAEGLDEDAIASAVVNELRLRLGDLYVIVQDDGEEIEIKRRPGDPKFSVSVVENTVQGLGISLDEE